MDSLVFFSLNTAEGGMALLDIGISGILLKSNIQVGKKILMDEVIGKSLSIKINEGRCAGV